jgi:hypothetical protein
LAAHGLHDSANHSACRLHLAFANLLADIWLLRKCCVNRSN